MKEAYAEYAAAQNARHEQSSLRNTKWVILGRTGRSLGLSSTKLLLLGRTEEATKMIKNGKGYLEFRVSW